MNMIVSKLVESAPMVETEGEIIEPAFGLDGCSSSTEAKYLSHKITRNINDLRSHAQRIYLFIKERQAKASYSALVDLFLVLESSGLALRKRMLASARTLLPEHEFKTLRQSLPLGLSTEIALPMVEQGLLTKGLTPSYREFIQKNHVETAVGMSPWEEAMSYIEHGELELAQTTLQKAIMADPHQLDLHYDLLEIFKKTANKDQFSSFYKQLLEQAIVLPPQWREMAQSFGIETKTA